jgi:hypothetical protein
MQIRAAVTGPLAFIVGHDVVIVFAMKLDAEVRHMDTVSLVGVTFALLDLADHA